MLAQTSRCELLILFTIIALKTVHKLTDVLHLSSFHVPVQGMALHNKKDQSRQMTWCSEAISDKDAE